MGPPPKTTEQLADEMAQDMAAAGQLAEPIVEAAAGYREKCKAAGFDEPVAQQMASDYHAGLLRLMLR